MWLEAERRSRGRWWDDIDRLIAALPPLLYRQIKLLEYDLALRYSATGQFRDVFSGVDFFPLLSVATWLLDDLRVPSNAARDKKERHFFTASILLAVRAQVIDSIRDPGGFTEGDRIPLVQWLSDRASGEFACVMSRDSSFWERYEAISLENAGRLLQRWERDTDTDAPEEPEALLNNGWSSAARLAASAVMASTRRDLPTQQVLEMLDDAAKAFQILSDVGSVHRHSLEGRLSYPIAVVARAARIPLRPRPNPDVILGAMVATGSLKWMVESVRARLLEARQAAIGLALPTFAAFLADAESTLGQRTAGEPSHGGGPGQAEHRPPLLRHSTPVVPQALAMAEGFLLGDLTFRESWEMHREGMFGVPEVASRFPAGLVMEILCRHEHDVQRNVDEFLDFTLSNGFRYYDHPLSGVDSDTVGVFLRLLPHATPSNEYGEGVALVLDCLDRNVSESGAIPVWITGCEESEHDRPQVVALGGGCGTVAAHLLLGLTAVPSRRHRETISTGARHLVNRIAEVGLGANVNYPPAYALGVFFRLLGKLESQSLWPGVRRRARTARGSLSRALELAAKTRPDGPQDAALLTLACYDANREDLLDPAWLVQVLKRQRFDGSWIGEPFAAAPNRGRSVSWYSSTLLTTALCYDALARGADGLAAATD